MFWVLPALMSGVSLQADLFACTTRPMSPSAWPDAPRRYSACGYAESQTWPQTNDTASVGQIVMKRKARRLT